MMAVVDANHTNNYSLVPMYVTSSPENEKILTHADCLARDGVCVYPVLIGLAQGYGITVSCPSWTKQGRLGCIDYLIPDEATCNKPLAVYGSGKWTRPAATKGECFAYGKEPAR